MKDLIIVGAGGLGRELAILVNRIGKNYQILGYVDDQVDSGTVVGQHIVLGKIEILKKYAGVSIVIAIGHSKIRKQISNRIAEIGSFDYPNIIDPTVIYENDGKLGFGNIITANSLISTNVTLGNFNLINWNCTIGHDAVIGDYVTINPKVAISGFDNIFDECDIGVGASILQGLSIGPKSVVGAGAVVIENVKEGVTVVGVPAREKVRRKIDE